MRRPTGRTGPKRHVTAVKRPRRLAAPEPAAAPQDAPVPVRGVRTTGLFTAPRGGGNLIQVVVFLSNFASRAVSARVVANRVVGGQLVTFFADTVEVPGGEARRLAVQDVEGQTLEVTVAAAEDIKPSAGVTQTFRADGATVVLVWKAPGNFVRV